MIVTLHVDNSNIEGCGIIGFPTISVYYRFIFLCIQLHIDIKWLSDNFEQRFWWINLCITRTYSLLQTRITYMFQSKQLFGFGMIQYTPQGLRMLQLTISVCLIYNVNILHEMSSTNNSNFRVVLKLACTIQHNL